MKHVKIFLHIVLLISSLSIESVVPEDVKFARIYGGYRPEKLFYAEHLVTLRYDTRRNARGSHHFCGGAIILQNVVITALHCVKNPITGKYLDKRLIRVVVGSTDLFIRSKNEKVLDVRKIVEYPNKSKTMGLGDLALLHLKQNIKEDGVHFQRIPLTALEPKAGDQCIFLGFGRVYPDGPLPDQVVYMNVTLQSTDFCGTPKELVCVGDLRTYPMLSESGDSGGPLICNGTLVGICSYVSDIRSYYVSVYQYLDWINENSGYISNKFICLEAIIVSLICIIIF